MLLYTFQKNVHNRNRYQRKVKYLSSPLKPKTGGGSLYLLKKASAILFFIYKLSYAEIESVRIGLNKQLKCLKMFGVAEKIIVFY